MRRRTQEEGGTPVASLIDVVFLLIIFFVVTASVEKEVIDRSIQLARAENAPATEERLPDTILINVDRNGRINIANIPLSLGRLQQILVGTYRDAGRHVPIVIRVDGDTPYRHVAEVQNVIGRAGFYRVRLAARATDAR